MTIKENLNREGTWTLHVDRSSNFKGSRIGLVSTSPSGDKIEQSIKYGFRATNNKVEYDALIVGLGMAKKLGIK